METRYTAPILCAEPDSSIFEVLKLMQMNLVKPLFTAISQVMSSPIISINSEETIWEAAELMKKNSIHKMPVEENKEIVGMLTATDLVKIRSLGSDSQMRRICDQILSRMQSES